jgi:hypothetical protein
LRVSRLEDAVMLKSLVEKFPEVDRSVEEMDDQGRLRRLT